MYVDLHCHSYYSDGTEAPESLVNAAIERGISHLALTDHDCLAGVERLWDALPGRVSAPPEGEVGAEGAEGAAGLAVIAGVEISCDWNGLEIHIVGLLETPKHPTLAALLHTQQAARRLRAAEIGAKLKACGINGLDDYLDALPATAITRSHVADFLVESGHCKSKQKAFKSHLGRRGKAYVAAEWCSLADAVTAIGDAGGIAVLAHPSRYPLTRSKLCRLLDDFRAAGGDAMEVSYGNLDPTAKKKLLQLAEDYGLYRSCGSDFHSPQAQWTGLGKYPRLEPSATKNAIWEHPRWRCCVTGGRAIASPLPVGALS